MKILVLALFVCAVNGAGIGGFFGSGISNLAANIANAGVGSGRNRVRNPIQAAAQIAAAPSAAANAAAAAIAAQAAASAGRVASVAASTAAKAPNTATISTSNSGPSATADAAPANSASTDSESEIIHYEADVRYDGYSYSFETSNGISAESTGELKKVNDTDVIVMKGSYKYTDKDGAPVMLTYIADENGFQPESSILPVGPPIPKEIARAIAYILSQIEASKENKEAR